AIVPHHPWQFLPDGRSYPFIVSSNPASFGGGWIDDDFLVAQAMQRHLLQVGYADHVVGEVIATLEDRGIYDDAMVVVTADHGIAIVPGVDHQRAITPETVGEIASVPLFIKYPNGDGGVIDDRRALTIDILPTIADVIGADLPDDVEGVSLLGPTPSRDSTTTTGPEGAVTYGVDGAEKLEVARRIERWFPDGDPWALLPPGSPDILGIDVDTSSLESSDLRVRLRESDLYEDVDTGDEVVPARVGGWVFGGSADGDEVLAVVVNGEVGAVTRTFVDEGTTSFLAMIPPDLLVDGANTIDIVEVDGGSLLRVAG
ncbi:MAG TPA: sulfatase-like hydrolase/transferase, partial [Acidimicrobiia bacterium]|nr:sulfatase-like hydrolase/transferase [Acidimicrobiia bacterium]